MKVCEIHRGETCRPRACSLEEAVEDAISRGVDAVERFIVQLRRSAGVSRVLCGTEIDLHPR